MCSCVEAKVRGPALQTHGSKWRGAMVVLSCWDLVVLFLLVVPIGWTHADVRLGDSVNLLMHVSGLCRKKKHNLGVRTTICGRPLCPPVPQARLSLSAPADDLHTLLFASDLHTLVFLRAR